MKKINNITPFEEDNSKWYSDLLLQSELISDAPVKGTMFLKPYGFKIWNLIKEILDKKFNDLGVEDVQFPLLLPEKLLEKEKENFKGFSPESLKITHVGNTKLNENYIVRPTSEALFAVFFKQTLNSYKELPMLLNQWGNVIRWENNTKYFLRNSEFFWQEGHTIHYDEKEALDFSKKINILYQDFMKEELLFPIFSGSKTIIEKFAGAENSFTSEILLKDGQMLQAGTSHYLGNRFAKAFDITVQDVDQKQINPFQTSWGVSTRLIGGLVMTHSDNKGLVLPSAIAPYQIVIVTLFADKNKKILEEALKIKDKLNNFRVHIDDENKGIGFKLRNWEVKGVPLIIEIGPNELKNKKVIYSMRSYENKKEIEIKSIDSKIVEKLLSDNNKNIFSKAKKLVDLKKWNKELKNFKDLSEILNKGNYIIIPWTENSQLEKELKDKYGATIRLLFNEKNKLISLSDNKTLTTQRAIIARAY